MIISDSFVKSQKARDVDFTTDGGNVLFEDYCAKL